MDIYMDISDIKRAGIQKKSIEHSRQLPLQNRSLWCTKRLLLAM